MPGLLFGSRKKRARRRREERERAQQHQKGGGVVCKAQEHLPLFPRLTHSISNIPAASAPSASGRPSPLSLARSLLTHSGAALSHLLLAPASHSHAHPHTHTLNSQQICWSRWPCGRLLSIYSERTKFAMQAMRASRLTGARDVFCYVPSSWASFAYCE